MSITFDPTYFVEVTGSGDWPGTDCVDSLQRVRGELGAPHLSFVPALHERGFAATDLARTIACLEGLSADGVSFGWRITEGYSREGRLAESLFASDINALADVVGREDSAGTGIKVQLLGPVSTAHMLYLGSGERALSDPGARRDLRDSFLAGLPRKIRALREAAPGERLVLQLNEPDLEKALAGTIPTASGYRRLRALPLAEAVETFSLVSANLHEQIDQLVLAHHSRDLDRDISKNFDALTMDGQSRAGSDWERIADQVESGRRVYLETLSPLIWQSPVDEARRLWKTWRTIGLPAQQLTSLTIIEAAGIAEVSPEQATAVLGSLTELSRILSEIARDN